MLSLEVAATANATIALPSLVLAKYHDYHDLHSSLVTISRPKIGLVRFVTESGTSILNFATVQHLASISNTTVQTQEVS
jgi:hypothetical protein